VLPVFYAILELSEKIGDAMDKNCNEARDKIVEEKPIFGRALRPCMKPLAL